MKHDRFHNVFDKVTAFNRSRLLPFTSGSTKSPVVCYRCSFINSVDYNFCINCGYPVHRSKNEVELYYQRLRGRKDLQQKNFLKIAHARNALYFLAGTSMLGIFYLFSEWKQFVLKGMLMVFLGIIYAGLARWSLTKPFTSLLISLMLLLTFAAINTWAEITGKGASAYGMFLLCIQIVFIYFLLQGVKGAFSADVLAEEFKL